MYRCIHLYTYICYFSASSKLSKWRASFSPFLIKKPSYFWHQIQASSKQLLCIFNLIMQFILNYTKLRWQSSVIYTQEELICARSPRLPTDLDNVAVQEPHLLLRWQSLATIMLKMLHFSEKILKKDFFMLNFLLIWNRINLS